jgi:hypothetical protein
MHIKWSPPALRALLMGGLVIAAATAVFALVIWTHGAVLSLDSRSYIQAGYNIATGNGFVLTRYEPATDSLIDFPLTHYPPFTSIVYAMGLWVGMPSQAIPPLIVSLGWTLFLGGIGMLTYRLGAPPFIAVLAIVVAALTHNYWFVFQVIISEAVFLPLLVWLMVVLVDLPAEYERQPGRVILAVVLLALAMLTRYVGVLVWLATLVWAGWWFVAQRKKRALAAAIGLHALAVLPFGGWVTYNLLSVNRSFSDHLNESRDTFLDGLLAFGYESIHLVLPALTPFLAVQEMVWWLVLAGGLVAAMLALLWRRTPRQALIHAHRTPLLLFVLLYSFLYTVVQPWFSFTPIDSRDAATLLCLMQPWLFGSVGRVLPRRLAYPMLSALVALNVALAFHPILFKGIPFWVSVNPPQVHAVSLERIAEDEWKQYGFLTWLVVRPVRTGNLPQYHPQLYAWLQSLDAGDTEVVVLTNGTLLFDAHLPVAVEYPDIAHPPGYVADWLSSGHCSSQYNTVVVLFEWDYLAESVAPYRQQVEQKCPGLEPRFFPHSVVYRLNASTDAADVGSSR